MIALFYTVLPKKIDQGNVGFSTQEFLDAIEHIPHTVLPEKRKKRTYISSILSKNEIDREDKYNRKLFIRVKHGHYLFNPNLYLKIEDEWINVYDLLSFDKFVYISKIPKPTFGKTDHPDKIKWHENLEKRLEGFHESYKKTAIDVLAQRRLIKK
jgi:hypothetical protein